jgi:hypothetical protein
MKSVVRKDVYFEEPGEQNTQEVLKAVFERMEETGIRTVLVASTTGKTGLTFAKAMEGKAKLITISYEKVSDGLKKNIEDLGAIMLDNQPLLLREHAQELRKALYAFGQGMKVCVEDAIIAVEVGVVEPYQDVISVAGTDKGADTAIIVRTTKLEERMSPDFNKRLEIREIICMPLAKKWWE